MQEGAVCKYFAFIVNGVMRQYSVDDKGEEHIVHLSIENCWAGDRESYVMLTPSVYNIDAWEDILPSAPQTGCRDQGRTTSDSGTGT